MPDIVRAELNDYDDLMIHGERASHLGSGVLTLVLVHDLRHFQIFDETDTGRKGS